MRFDWLKLGVWVGGLMFCLSFWVLLTIVCATAFSSPAQPRVEAASLCDYFCWWPQTNYEPTNQTYAKLCAATLYGGPSAKPVMNSAKNRCGSRTLRIGFDDGSGPINWKACLLPGDNRPDPGRFNTEVGSVPGVNHC